MGPWVWKVQMYIKYFIFGFILGSIFTASLGCVSYEPIDVSRPSEVELEVQPGDDEVITEDDGITVGMLREALKAEADREDLEDKQEEDAKYLKEKMDEANWKIGGLLVTTAGLLVWLILK